MYGDRRTHFPNGLTFFFLTRHWLAKQPSYAASREFDVGSARTTGVLSSVTNDVEDEAEADSGPPGVKRTVIQFMPSYGMSHRFITGIISLSKLISIVRFSLLPPDIQHSIFYRTLAEILILDGI